MLLHKKKKKLINKRLRRGQLSLLEHFHFRLRCAVWNFTPQLCPLLALACLSIRRLGFLLGGTFPRSLLYEAASPLPSVPCMPSSSLTSRLCPKPHSPLTVPRLPAAVSASSSCRRKGSSFLHRAAVPRSHLFSASAPAPVLTCCRCARVSSA